MSERRHSSRFNFQTPVKIWIEPTMRTGKPQTPVEPIFMWGETQDLSAAGVAFFVPSIRIKENYLVGDCSTLNAEMDLPAGKVQMQIVGQRYEQVGEHQSVARYLIGASILQMKAEDREIYENFLLQGKNIKQTPVRPTPEKTKEPAREVLETI